MLNNIPQLNVKNSSRSAIKPAWRSLQRVTTRALTPIMMIMLSFGPVFAGDFCADQRQRAGQNEADAAELIGGNPGSSVVFASCLVIGAGRYNQDHDSGAASLAYAGCAGLGCIMTDSYGNCLAVNVKLFALALKNMKIEEQKRQYGCQF